MNTIKWFDLSEYGLVVYRFYEKFQSGIVVRGATEDHADSLKTLGLTRTATGDYATHLMPIERLTELPVMSAKKMATFFPKLKVVDKYKGDVITEKPISQERIDVLDRADEWDTKIKKMSIEEVEAIRRHFTCRDKTLAKHLWSERAYFKLTIYDQQEFWSRDADRAGDLHQAHPDDLDNAAQWLLRATYLRIRSHIENSNYLDWKWGGGASVDGLIDFLKTNVVIGDVMTRQTFDDSTVDYLLSVGQDPLDYGFDPKRSNAHLTISKFSLELSHWREELLQAVGDWCAKSLDGAIKKATGCDVTNWEALSMIDINLINGDGKTEFIKNEIMSIFFPDNSPDLDAPKVRGMRVR